MKLSWYLKVQHWPLPLRLWISWDTHANFTAQNMMRSLSTVLQAVFTSSLLVSPLLLLRQLENKVLSFERIDTAKA